MDKQKAGRELPVGARAGGLSYSAVALFTLILSAVLGAIVSVSGAKTDYEWVKYLNYLVSPAAIGITFTLCVKLLGQPAKRLVPLRVHPKYIALGVLLIFGLLFSLNMLNEYFVEWLESLGYERRTADLPDWSGAKIVAVLLVIAVVPAIAEEVMFRGVLLNNAEAGAGSVRTVFLAGLCFSLFHGTPEQTLYQFVCGCAFAALAIRSGSLVPSIIIHFLNNAVIIILSACGALDSVTGELLVSYGGGVAIYVLSAISLAAAIAWLILDGARLEKREDGKRVLRLDTASLKPCEKGSIKDFFLYAAVGIGAMATVWIANLVAGL